MSISALLFDCDGTLFPNVEKAHAHATLDTLEQALKQQELAFDEGDAQRIWEEGLGKGILAFFQSYIAFHEEHYNDNIANKLTPEALEKSYEQSFIQLTQRVKDHAATKGEANFFTLRKGLTETLALASQHNIPAAVVSNALQPILNATLSTAPQIADNFALVAGADTIKNAGYETKPAGGSYQYAGNTLGIKLKNAVGYEDTALGLTSLNDSHVGHIVFCFNEIGSQANSFETSPNLRIDTIVGLHMNIAEDIPIIEKLSKSPRKQPKRKLQTSTIPSTASAYKPI